MLKTLIKEIFDPIFAAISPNWIDRYGGLVEVWEQEKVIDPEKGTTRIEKIPISCDVDQASCNEPNAKYKHLVPDQSKTSIVYWEEITPMTFQGFLSNGGFSARNWQKWTGRARLVVWLNAAKLGIGEQNNNYVCNWEWPFLDQLLKLVSTNGKFLTGDFTGGLYNVEVNNIVPNGVKQIFGKYTYNLYKNFYRYPYGTFAIDVDFEVSYCVGKNTSPIVTTAINCPFSQVEGMVGNQYAMTFDGVDEDISTESNTILSFAPNFRPFTVMAWVDFDDYNDNNYIASKGGLVGELEYAIRTVNGGITVFFFDQGTLTKYTRWSTSDSILTPGYHHIAFSYDGVGAGANNVKIYLDGVAVATSRVVVGGGFTSFINASGPFYIGSLRAVPAYAAGDIDEVYIYDNALSATTILDFYNSLGSLNPATIPGLLAANRMGDGATYDGTNWTFIDLAGNISTWQSNNQEADDRTTNIPV